MAPVSVDSEVTYVMDILALLWSQSKQYDVGIFIIIRTLFVGSEASVLCRFHCQIYVSRRQGLFKECDIPLIIFHDYWKLVCVY